MATNTNTENTTKMTAMEALKVRRNLINKLKGGHPKQAAIIAVAREIEARLDLDPFDFLAVAREMRKEGVRS